jgi:hypothetical protein
MSTAEMNDLGQKKSICSRLAAQIAKKWLGNLHNFPMES